MCAPSWPAWASRYPSRELPFSRFFAGAVPRPPRGGGDGAARSARDWRPLCNADNRTARVAARKERQDEWESQRI